MNARLQLRLLAHTIDATTLSVPPRRRRSRGYGIPASAAVLAVAAFVLIAALTGMW